MITYLNWPLVKSFFQFLSIFFDKNDTGGRVGGGQAGLIRTQFAAKLLREVNRFMKKVQDSKYLLEITLF